MQRLLADAGLPFRVLLSLTRRRFRTLRRLALG